MCELSGSRVRGARGASRIALDHTPELKVTSRAPGAPRLHLHLFKALIFTFLHLNISNLWTLRGLGAVCLDFIMGGVLCMCSIGNLSLSSLRDFHYAGTSLCTVCTLLGYFGRAHKSGVDLAVLTLTRA